MMENSNNGYGIEENKSLKDYISLLRNNIVTVAAIVIICSTVAIIYAVNSTDIYIATVTLKIAQPKGSILESPMPEFQNFNNDRFITNEIEVIKSYTVREKVAGALYDSLQNNDKKFSTLMNKDFEFSLNQNNRVLSTSEVADMLSNYVEISQKRGMDIVEISVQSPSPQGAALMANTYADEYRNVNLDQNRNQLTLVKNFLKDQRLEKLNELKEAEELQTAYQQKGGIIALDEQASSLINTLSNFEAQKNAAQIELSASSKVLNQYKAELEKQDPRLADYLESIASESYFKSLQEQIAKLELNKDNVLSSGGNANSNAVKEYDQRINELKKKLNDKLEVIKSGIYASSPEEVKDLSQKIIQEEIKNQTLRTTHSELASIVDRYDARFNRLPKTAIEYARLERKRGGLEKLYSIVEEKYQEALINELSQPGNVLIIDNARVPSLPAKPNRKMIILIGFLLGTGLAYGYIFVKNYFDNTIKTPEDIQNRNVNVLAWIPKFEEMELSTKDEFEFIIARKPDSISAEAFRALRTRIQFSKIGKNNVKTILVTSSIPQEGKTTVSINIAGSFAQANKRVLLVDCDLRKPRIHTVFNGSRYPGLIDYLFGQVKFEEVVRKSEVNNLSYITSGTIPPNPVEMIDSEQMRAFISFVREKFDIVVIDSPPIIAVSDSELLNRMVDATILIVSAEKTETEMLDRSIELIKNESSAFIGTVLNNFNYKGGYGTYYKYYYYYNHTPNGKDKRKAAKTKNIV
ncbi:MAG: polysaccharide biosynthesis tyrosine autokinase [Ignavibacteriaceae bacterium]